MTILDQYKKPIVIIAFILAIVKMLTTGDLPILGKYTSPVILATSFLGLITYMVTYQSEPIAEKAPKPHHVYQPPTPKEELDISKVIDQAHGIVNGDIDDKQKDIFSGFK